MQSQIVIIDQSPTGSRDPTLPARGALRRARRSGARREATSPDALFLRPVEDGRGCQKSLTGGKLAQPLRAISRGCP
jgi:hypothetical protein